MVNGEAIMFFKGQDLIGGPLSSLFFILELFSSLMTKVVRSGALLLHPRCFYPCITHLRCIDDLMVFFGGDTK